MRKVFAYKRVTRHDHARHDGQGHVLAHIVIAETALGHSLPAGAEIHHVDENTMNNAHANLVICQDRAYHRLLHVRARVVRAGGDPNTHKMCGGCRTLKPFSEFCRARLNKGDGLQQRCRQCQSDYQKRYARPRKRVAA